MCACASMPQSNLAQAIENLHVGEKLDIETPKCVVKRDGYSFFSIETPTLMIFNLTHKVVIDKLEKGLSHQGKMHDDEFFAAP